MERRGWHSLRRKMVNDLKAHTPLADLAELGGWKSSQTLLKVYMKADEQTMRGAIEIREQRRAARTAKQDAVTSDSMK